MWTFRYYNSWCDHMNIYIQLEFCNAGTMTSLIMSKMRRKEPVAEGELKTQLLHVGLGLQYMHASGTSISIQNHFVIILMRFERIEMTELVHQRIHMIEFAATRAYCMASLLHKSRYYTCYETNQSYYFKKFRQMPQTQYVQFHPQVTKHVSYGDLLTNRRTKM